MLAPLLYRYPDAEAPQTLHLQSLRPPLTYTSGTFEMWCSEIPSALTLNSFVKMDVGLLW